MNQSNPPIPKNMPPNSGNICWSRSIITRIKSPIDKFKTKPEILTSEPYGKSATTNYVQTAKLLTEHYEFEMFQKWKTQNIQLAIDYLSKNILITVGDGDDKKFQVNFNPRLKVIIREAKFLDRIGKDIPNTIINIALQEKDYRKNIDKLNQLLRSYNAAMLEMRPVEKKLLEKQISSLNYSMDKGTLNHNWFSLSIPEYIRECTKAIDTFKEIKARVLSSAQSIEKLVKSIENAVIIRPIDFSS
jgi:dynein heavy chain